MTNSRRLKALFALSLFLWLAAMCSLYYFHYIKEADEELGYFSSDVLFDDETRQYYNIYLDGRKIGYKNEAQFRQINLDVLREDATFKLNLAGMSREVFLQTTTGIDSSTNVTKYMDFTLSSGEHVNNFNAIVKEDSLIVMVRNNTLSEIRKGVFIVDEQITLPVALPYFLHKSESDILSMHVFDPVEFTHYIVHAGRVGSEKQTIGDTVYHTVRYDIRFRSSDAVLWLDSKGKVVKSEGYPLFSGVLGRMSIEKGMDKDVFLLPLEVNYGNDILKALTVYPQDFIDNPRDVSYMDVEFKNMRAANIDITAPNKRTLSLNPVRFALYNHPVAQGKQLLEEQTIAASDTSIIGMSDYIQPYDARIYRKAREIVGAYTDSLKMAQTLNRWVYDNVEQVEGLDIIRSVDILRNLKGDCDERTKLVTALARSIKIPTQITMGLVYKDRAFRYHSWPSVFVGGTWHDLDPTFGQDHADATHISLFRGDFDKVVELHRLMNFISIKVNTYR
ncbi:transglutaminase family protein [Candidatus Latescibacterota bacterium]